MTNRRLLRPVVGGLLIVTCASCVPKAGTDGIKDAATSSCAAERHLVEQAVEAYYILEGANPTLESQLVPNYLRTESASMDIGADGSVVAAPGSGCS